MTFEHAQLEFKKRYYLWSKSVGETDVNEGFPHFCLFKGGATWTTSPFKVSYWE
jgi:hypothetical protein